MSDRNNEQMSYEDVCDLVAEYAEASFVEQNPELYSGTPEMPGSSSTRRKAGQAKRKSDRTKAKLLEKARAEKPAHIKLLDVDSPQWKQLLEADPAYKQARCCVASLIYENKNTIEYPTFKGDSDEEIVAKFMAIISDDEMRPIEERFAGKFGSFWQPKYSEWSHKVYELYKETSWNPDLEVLEASVQAVLSKLKAAAIKLHGADTLQPLTIADAWKQVSRGKNSGYPFFTKKWAAEGNGHMVEYYLAEAQKLLDGEHNLIKKPFVLFKRIQVNGSTPKMRPIQGAPKEDSIASKCFTAPLVELFKTIPQFTGFNGGERVGKYVKKDMMAYSHLLSADFSAFDANAQEIVSYAFEVIKGLFPEETHQYLDNTLEAYQHIKLITPTGIIYSDKINGVASGCGFTSVEGTIVNAICTEYTMRKLGIVDSMTLSFGDDIAIATNEPINLDSFALAMQQVGMECNQSKQEYSTEYFSFLGYFHWRGDNNDLGRFPVMRLAPGFKYMERSMSIGDIIRNLSDTVGQEEANELRAQLSRDNMDAMALASKLNVARGNKDFVALCQLVKDSTDILTEEALKPLLKYRTLFRAHRTSRAAEFPVIDALFGEKCRPDAPTNEEWNTAHRLANLNQWPLCSLTNKPDEQVITRSRTEERKVTGSTDALMDLLF